MISHSKNVNCSRQVISEAEHKYTDNFFNVCYENIYCTKFMIKLYVLIVITEDSKTVVLSQRMINKHLIYHPVYIFYTSTRDISAIGSQSIL